MPRYYRKKLGKFCPHIEDTALDGKVRRPSSLKVEKPDQLPPSERHPKVRNGKNDPGAIHDQIGPGGTHIFRIGVIRLLFGPGNYTITFLGS